MVLQEDAIRQVVRSVIEEVMKDTSRNAEAKYVPVAISGKHAHLSREHIDTLFGAGFDLNKLKDLSQPGQYAAREQVTLVGPLGVIERVRVLGPPRKKTQVEISRTDSFRLGIKTPVRDSGSIAGSPGITIAGPRGCIYIAEGVILAARHLHLSPKDAESLGVTDKQRIRIRTRGERAVSFDNVMVRVDEAYAMDLHLDPDEANAALLDNGDLVEVIAEN